MEVVRSAGAALYTVQDGETRWVLVREKSGSVGLPKGHVEKGETPKQTALREIREETGLTVTGYRYRGIVTFVSDRWETEYMHLFTADAWTGSVRDDCGEGVLEWIHKDRLAALPQWAGDRIFLDLLRRDVPFFSLKLRYQGETLVYACLNGRELVL